MKKLLIILIVLILISLIGCTTDSGGSSKPKDFTMNFLKNYIMGTGWVILQLDDIIEYQEVNGDETIVFENVNSWKGTVMIIQDYYYSDQRQIRITVDVDAPLDEWYLKGTNDTGESLGEYEVTLTYPEEDYTKFMISTPFYSMTWGCSPGDTTVTKQRNVYRLDDNENISFFSAVYNEDTGSAYCNWGLDLPFNLGEINPYTFDLDKEMQSKSVSVNRFITSSGIFAYRNGMLDRNTLDYNWYNESAVTEFLAFYTDDFPHDKFMTYVSYYGDTENYYFRQIGDDIPSELIIPESSISADFDYENNKFANISIDGSADQIAAYWTQEDSTKFVSLTVYSKTNVEEIQIPELPTEVLDQLNIDLTLFTLNNIGINEYDTADDFDDIINMVFQQQAPFVSLYNQNYSYRKYDDPEVLRNHKEYRTERDINFVE